MTDYFRNSELHVFRISVVQNKKNYEIRVLLSIIDNVLTARVTIVKRTLLMFFKSTLTLTNISTLTNGRVTVNYNRVC